MLRRLVGILGALALANCGGGARPLTGDGGPDADAAMGVKDAAAETGTDSSAAEAGRGDSGGGGDVRGDAPDARPDGDASVATDGGDGGDGPANVAGDGGDAGDDAQPVPETPGGESTNYAVNAAHDNAQVDSTVASPLTKAWSKTFGGAASYPLIAMSHVFVAAAEAQPTVNAFDLASGTTVWGPLAIGSNVTLAYDEGRVYWLDRTGKLGALSGVDGHRVWSTQIQGQLDFWSAPVAAGGWIYVNGMESGGTTYAIVGSTGMTRWTANTFDGSDGAVAVSNGVVYEAEACDQLSAFEAPTLVLLWFAHTGCTGGGGSTPSVYDGMIWQRDWAQGNVIVDSAGQPQGAFAADTPPSFHDGLVFYMSKHTLTAVDVATSTVKWTFTGDGMLCTSAAIAGRGGQVFVGSASGLVYELDERTGILRSMDDVGAPVSCGAELASMAVGGNHLVVSAGNKLVVY